MFGATRHMKKRSPNPKTKIDQDQELAGRTVAGARRKERRPREDDGRDRRREAESDHDMRRVEPREDRHTIVVVQRAHQDRGAEDRSLKSHVQQLPRPQGEREQRPQ